MNRIPSRDRMLKRLAATTAAAVGAALLAAPGTAAAQQDIGAAVDCASLGGNPIAAGLERALEAAVACGVEVRINARATPHATVYATPDKRLHYVGTAAPVQDYLDRGPADSSLVASGGTLAQANAAWPLTLSHSDTTAPLLATDGVKFDWNGPQPVPTHSGSTAFYDELAPGLDLSVDTAVSWADLTFTIADAAAWDALDTGLTVTAGGTITVAEDTLVAPKNVSGLGRIDVTSPFLVRDAAGGSYRAELTRATDGKLTVALPPDIGARYPLTLTTSWSEIGGASAWWGASTSAQPDLSLYRGEAGLDQPYFEAAGASAPTVVGAYCDALADPDCASPAQAAANWGFFSPTVTSLVPPGLTSPSFTLIESTFRVDAVGGECTAPDLNRTGTYIPGHNWDYRPSVAGGAITGSCQDGAAVYDLAPWLTPNVLPTNLAMLASAETARFDGDSARMDAYYAINHFSAPTFPCHTDPDSRNISDSADLSYGNMNAKLWRPDLFGTDMTWAATVRNRDTGEVLAATEPVAVVSGWSTGVMLRGLPDGRYETRYEFTASDPALSFTRSCYVETDTSAPDLEFAVLPGPRNVGGEVELAITVSDNGFPNGIDFQEISYSIGDADHETHGDYRTQKATSTVTVPLWSVESKVWVRAMDRVGNYAEDGISVYAHESRYDFNGDGSQDLMAVGNGNLYFYPGKGDGTFGSRVSLGGGWGAMDVVMAGDLTGDGKADLLARDPKTGTLYTYPGDGKGGIAPRIAVGPGWNAMGAFASAGDFNGDGKVDLLAVRKSDTKLYLYPGTGNGRFGTSKAIGSGWNVFDTLASPGDIDNDGDDDLLARDVQTGGYYLYPGNGSGSFGTRVAVPANLDGTGNDRFRQVAGVGDLDGDGFQDLLAIDSRTGERELHSLTGGGAARHEGIVGASGWAGIRLPAPVRDSAFDYNGDGITDAIVVDKDSALGPGMVNGDGSGNINSTLSFAASFGNWNDLESAGDMTGDGRADLLVRGADGDLHLHPGTGRGGFTSPSIKIGAGWNAFSLISGGADYNGDGKADIIARETATGSLWLYPGKGDGTLGTRVLVGNGWNAMREVEATGDLDHDGHADMLAIRISDGCLYFYGGKGNGTFKPMAKIGCGWGAMNAITGVGDFNRDGHVDWFARRKSDGALFFYPGNGAGNHGAAKVVATGWNAMTIA
ncbi:FG-GAP repeat domain-containing protein [Glycomyces tritici]|uniref:VCBS repeat-containing protein n=1 Tax=Glycomyces tritici TaxID=2665176 RepID=A0ABT7YQ85_9ACTN|nr:VCBS repeat-containing protein [Glycomyces tritici]MDN3240751.1 VCBS repeat-containing protein [Glycomyces tritici]